ncbi:hypothetical protein BLNAU_17878 [Blattamonas nauphoetae]|uniref:Uncharacterized protein n=1 Tax=Blattamonas nauphoetae TaxID=2049346 RepID=A0ABQ9X6E6_9EUKA|nr:hypothetical protein BLNAU_17878 [Blattamonas nauphoetae]
MGGRTDFKEIEFSVDRIVSRLGRSDGFSSRHSKIRLFRSSFIPSMFGGVPVPAIRCALIPSTSPNGTWPVSTSASRRPKLKTDAAGPSTSPSFFSSVSGACHRCSSSRRRDASSAVNFPKCSRPRTVL